MTTVWVHGSGWALPYEIQKDNFEFVRRKSVTVPFRPPQQSARTSQSCLRARALPWLPLHLPHARQIACLRRSAGREEGEVAATAELWLLSNFGLFSHFVVGDGTAPVILGERGI